MISTETMVRRSRRAVAACACVAIAAAFALSAAARAHAAWSPHVNIAKQQRTFLPKVSMDPAGNAVFMWQSFDRREIYTRSRAADGSLSPIRRITDSASPDYALAVDQQGNAYYVWAAVDSAGSHARARVRYANGTLSPVQTLATVEPYSVGQLTVGVDASGRAVFAWRRTTSQGDSGLIQARSRSASGKLSAVHTVARERSAFFDMGVDADGNAIFGWEDRTDGGLAEFTRVLEPNGDLGPAKRISRVGDNVSPPQVVVTPSGRAIFGWSESDSDALITTLYARARAANGSFQPAQVLSRFSANGGQTIADFQVAAAPTDEAVFCWQANGALHARTRAPGGALGPVKTIAPVRASCQAGVDSDGNLAFAWDAFAGDKERIFARSGDAAGHLQPPQALSSASYNSAFPELAVNPAGAAAIAWRAGNRGFGVQASFGP